MIRGEGVKENQTLFTDLMLELVGPQPDAPSSMEMLAVNIYNGSIVEEGQLNGMTIAEREICNIIYNVNLEFY